MLPRAISPCPLLAAIMEDTISGFEAILNGGCDELPENAFMYVGTIDEAIEKAKNMNK